jgi:hypothetical protein
MLAKKSAWKQIHNLGGLLLHSFDALDHFPG